ncbi:MAG: dTDP-4-amino-4,6-dideoxygalactose transaminase [bacterium]
MFVSFNKPYLAGNELEYIRQACAGGHLSGNGPFTQKCEGWLRQKTGAKGAFLTSSGTDALEMAAILAGIGPGDEIIMPSYTFVSSANAFVLRGGVPVFVDIRPDTLNLDEKKIAEAITPRTKAILVVHYAGVACEMDAVLEIARTHDLLVIEDAAQGIGSRYRGKPLGSLGHLAAFSFHETKNIISGEGGALLVNDARLLERAEMVWEKGTDRSQFLQGLVDKYTWRDIGSSFAPGELTTAFLWAQMESFDFIMEKRMELWKNYHRFLQPAEEKNLLRRSSYPDGTTHNAHLYFILLPDAGKRGPFLKSLNEKGINAVFHYVPLHDSPGGQKYGRVHGAMTVTEDLSGRIVRLPLWVGMTTEQDRVIEVVLDESKKLFEAH